MAQTASKLLGLVPAVTCERDIDMIDVRLYHNDMPSPELFSREHDIVRWKVKYLAKAVSERPSCASALTDCDKDLYPYIYMYTLLQIACTLSVTSSGCECNASTLC